MKTYKIIIYIIVAVVILGALIYFVYIPQIGGSVELWIKNTLKQGQIQALEKERANLDALKKEEKEVEELTNILSSLLPEKKESGRFMIEMEALANTVSVNLGSIKYTEEKKTTPASSSSSGASDTTKSQVKGVSSTPTKLKELIFEITINGSYTNLISFLKNLEKLDRATTIEKADFSETQGVVQANIKGKIYYKND